MGNFLEVPGDLAGSGLERDDAIRIKIRALSCLSIEVGCGIADTPVDEIEVGIVGAGHPRGASSEFPAVPQPGLVPLFARPGDSVKAPPELTRLPLIGNDVTAVGGIPTGGAHNNHVFHDN